MLEIKIKDLSFEKLFLLLFTPFAFLMILDLASTYLGVCVLGGYELQAWAITFGVQYGFLFIASFYIFKYVISNLAIAYFLKKSQHHEIWKIFLIVVWAVSLISIAQSLMLNFNSLFGALTNVYIVPQKQLINIPISQAKEIAMAFEGGLRSRFCRLI